MYKFTFGTTEKVFCCGVIIWGTTFLHTLSNARYQYNDNFFNGRGEYIAPLSMLTVLYQKLDKNCLETFCLVQIMFLIEF